MKKHYEKVLLSMVLLGLAVAAAMLPMKISAVQEAVQIVRTKLFEQSTVNKFQPIDLSTNQMVLQRMQTSNHLDLALPHNVFNPVKWERLRDGRVRPIRKEIGPEDLTVVRINPLNTVISYEGNTAENSFRFQIKIDRETERGRDTKTRLLAVAPGSRADNELVLQGVRGPKETPDELLLYLPEERKVVSISPGKPYSEVTGYLVDLRFDRENKTWLKQKKGDKITFNKETYKIIAITESEVVLSAESNKKPTTIKYIAAK